MSDFILPDLTGLELADQLFLRQPHIPFILVSGYSDYKSHENIMKERKVRFLQKPYNIDEFFRTVKELVEH